MIPSVAPARGAAARRPDCIVNFVWRTLFLNYPRSGGGFRGPRRPVPEETHRINHRITAKEVRLIGEDGSQLGVVQIRDALRIAEETGLDLVEVGATASPPVCRLMDYGKFKYREQKKEAQARKKRSDNVVKELRIRYLTDIGDLEVKLKQARNFLKEGDKVKFSMRFRGREIEHVKRGEEKFTYIVEQLAEVASVDERSPVTGRQIYIVFAPLKH